MKKLHSKRPRKKRTYIRMQNSASQNCQMGIHFRLKKTLWLFLKNEFIFKSISHFFQVWDFFFRSSTSDTSGSCTTPTPLESSVTGSTLGFLSSLTFL